MTIGPGPLLCTGCIHFELNLDNDDLPIRCAAFPDGIPDEILWEGVDHHKPYPGDHGIQFELKNQTSK